MAYNPGIAYGLYEVGAVAENATAQPGEKLVLADALAERDGLDQVESHKRLRDVTVDELSGLTLAHPYRGIEGGNGEWDYDFAVLRSVTLC